MHPVQPVAWVVALGTLLVVVGLLARGLRRHGLSRPGVANLVTLTRAALTCAVAGLVVQSFTAPTSARAVTVLAAVALALDAVDGPVARHLGTATPLGARFDMETDALLILVLSLYVGHGLGWWVVLVGLARYLLLGAQALWPLLRGDVPPRRWRKVVAATQGVVLVVAAGALLPRPVTVACLGLALAMLVLSFGTEVRERVTGESSLAPVLSGLALVLVWVALAAPGSGTDLSPWLLLRVPLEGLLLVAVVLVLPPRWGGRLAVPFGLLAGLLLTLKALNLGFTAVLDRPFRPIGDWGYLGPAVGVLADSVGRPVAVLVAVLAGCLLVAVLVLVALATRRVCRAARRHRRPAVVLVACLAALSLVPHGLSAASATLAVDQAQNLRAELRDQSVFAAEIADDPYASEPGDRLLQGLRGKDVLVVFVESYGRSAVEDSSFAPGVDAVLDDGTRRLKAAGYGSRSAFLTSPTFGAASWLAHATTQSGLWVDSQRRYDQLIDSDRLTLSETFDRAGWRTVFDVPANTRDWPEGQAFYGFDTLYDARNVDYRGPAFGYASMPDQYTLSHLRAAELLPGDRPPVMAEVDLVSSHHPWAPLPRLVPWADVGDGSVFEGMPDQGDSMEEVFSDPDRVREAYGQSIEYTLDTVVSFLTTYPDDDLVVLMLGDHQPHHYVSGDDPGHDVPVTVIARDQAVLARIADWGWSPGLRPPTDAPLWRMDSLRDRFLDAFSDPAPAGR